MKTEKTKRRRLDATDGKQANRAEVGESSFNTVLLNFINFLKDPPYCHNVLKFKYEKPNKNAYKQTNKQKDKGINQPSNRWHPLYIL